MADFFPALGVVVAALGGAAIGVERQWSGHATGTHPHLGGVRTFTLIGGAAGLAGALATAGYAAVAATVVAGLIAVVVLGYLAASRNHIDATTEVAAVVVVATGFLAGIGWIQLSSGAVAITALLLIEKSRLHAFVERIDDEDLRAAARFAVMAVVVLPILPEGPLDRFGGIRPRELWLFVLFFSGISFIGYLARRAIGSAQGYPWAGLLGGLVSSTAVTFSFARLSRSDPAISRPLAIGALGASTVLFPRVLVAAVVLNADVARTVALLTAAAFVVGAVLFVWYLRHSRSEAANVEGPRNPLQLGPALQMAVTFQIVLFAVQYVRRWFGDAGLVISGAVLGLTDVDALTLSMARGAGAGIDPGLAARAIVVGVMSNCVMKAILSITLGTKAYGWFTAATLAAMIAAMGVALVIFR